MMQERQKAEMNLSGITTGRKKELLPFLRPARNIVGGIANIGVGVVASFFQSCDCCWGIGVRIQGNQCLQALWMFSVVCRGDQDWKRRFSDVAKRKYCIVCGKIWTAINNFRKSRDGRSAQWSENLKGFARCVSAPDFGIERVQQCLPDGFGGNFERDVIEKFRRYRCFGVIGNVTNQQGKVVGTDGQQRSPSFFLGWIEFWRISTIISIGVCVRPFAEGVVFVGWLAFVEERPCQRDGENPAGNENGPFLTSRPHSIMMEVFCG